MAELPPRDKEGLHLISVDEKSAFQLSKKLGTGLSAREVEAVRAHFRALKREPTEIELQTIGQTWSEHCFHKIFKSQIRVGKKVIDGLFTSYIKRATDEIGANWIVSSFSDNAGIVKFEETYSIAAKVETHNHPSAIDPFGGAATGVGGVIRDVLGVWAEPIANTDVLCFGDLDFPYGKLPNGIKHPRYLLNGVVAGIGSYGNNMGIPTVNGAVHFDNSFAGYTLVFCGCIGLLKNRNYVRSGRPGDVLVIAGARTGKDGLHGVNFASVKISGDTDELRSAVQIPDPIVEEKLKRAVLEIADRHLASAITDLGGGGLSSGVCEVAHSFGCGVEVDLNSIPLKVQEMVPWEIWLSETQERMLLIVPEPTLAKVLSVFEREEIEASAFGKLTPGKEIVLIKREEGVIGRLDTDFLFSPPLQKLEAKVIAPKEEKALLPKSLVSTPDFSGDLISLLKSSNIASKEGIVRTYDHEVMGNTVVKPFEYPNSGPNDAAVLKPVQNSERGLVISSGLNPSYSTIDTYWMAASAIDEAIRNNVAVGGRRIALLDNFAWGNPEDPENLGKLVRAAEACFDIAKGFGTPFISGKDSLYNETPIGEISPTLLITALGVVPEISRCITADFKQPGSSVYLAGETRAELGGSEYFRLKKIKGGAVPKVEAEAASSLYRAVNRATDQNFVRACHDISQGGLAVALSEMCFANAIGAEIQLPQEAPAGLEKGSPAVLSVMTHLFSESNSRFLIEVEKGEEDKFEKIMKGFPISKIGTVLQSRIVVKDSSGKKMIDIPTENAYASWRSVFQ